MCSAMLASYYAEPCESRAIQTLALTIAALRQTIATTATPINEAMTTPATRTCGNQRSRISMSMAELYWLRVAGGRYSRGSRNQLSPSQMTMQQKSIIDERQRSTRAARTTRR